MPDQLAPARAGLYTRETAPVPLAGVVIDAEMSSIGARVSVSQRYVNREAAPIEAVYLFPLDEGAAVCGFEALIDGTLVIGEVKERDEAFRMYDDAMERGDGAFLLDAERSDVFQASIGNLPPGKEVTIKLTYVTELAAVGRGLRFVIPTTVSPRYSPLVDRTGVGRPDEETLNPPRAFRVPYGLELTIRLAMNGTVTRLESPSHPISVVMNGSTATVALSSRDTALDRDFVLSVEADGLERPAAWIEQDDDASGAIAVAFAPDFGATSAPADVTFLVDRSGSMAGSSIEEVRNALQLCLRSLTPGCRFNIVGFGTRWIALFPGSREYNETSLAEASAHVAALQADLGGTELLPALSFVLQPPAQRALPRQVVVLTDGEVTNTDAVLELANAHANDARIFVFGIGAGASHHLVRGLARAGRGSAEFIFPGERIEPKVIRQLGRLLTPALTNVAVDWRGLDVKPATTAAPPVFAGERLVVYAFGTPSVPATVRLTAESPSGPLAFDVGLDPTRAVRGRTVPALAARARIRELEESPAWLTARGSRQADRKGSVVRQEIVQLATKYGLLSRETSYVAIERRETPVTGEVQLRRLPIALTSGWADAMPARALTSGLTLGMPMAGFAALSAPDGDAQSPMSYLRATKASASLELERLTGRAGSARGRPGRSDDAGPSAPPARRPGMASPPPSLAPMYRLIALQRADGSWDLTEELAAAMERSLPHLEEGLDAAAGTDVRRAWATALALGWLHRFAADTEPQWRLLAAKAEQYLAGTAAPAPEGVSWRQAAAAFLARN